MPRKKKPDPPIDEEWEQNGKTLIELCRNKQLEEVKMYLQEIKKVDVNYILPQWDKIALREVLSRPNQEQMLKLLIKHKADVNLATKNHGKPLNFFLQNSLQSRKSQDIDYIKILLRSGADLHSIDTVGHSAFFLALQNHDKEVFKVIFDHCLSVSNSEEKKYYQLCRYITTESKVNMDYLKDFLEDVENINFPTVAKAESPLFFAVRQNNLEIVRILLKKGSDPNNANYALSPHYILHYVLYDYSNIEMLKLLLDYKMNLNFQIKIDSDLKNETPLTWLIQPSTVSITTSWRKQIKLNKIKKKKLDLPKIDTLKLMLDSGAQINIRNSKRQTALHIACNPDFRQTFDMEVIKILLSYNVDVNLQDNSKDTALHKAIFYKRNNEEVVKMLLQKGANPHLLNKYNQTILHLACFSSVCTPIEIVRLILDLDVYTWVRDTDERLALHHACSGEKGSTEVVKLLIQKMIDQGVEKNLPFVENNKLKLQKLKDKHKFTPLNEACHSGKQECSEIVKILLQHDVDVNHPCESSTPLLDSLKNFEITELLLKNGANPNQKNFSHHYGLLHRKYEVPLQQACQYTDAKTVKLLIDYGADILIEDEDKNLLHYALENSTSSFEVLKLLLKTRVLSVEDTNENGQSVLDKCSNDCSKVALIWSYANININLNTLRRCFSHSSPNTMCHLGLECLIYDYFAKLSLLGCNFNQAFSSEVAFYSQLYNKKNYNAELDKMKTILVNNQPKLSLYDVLFMKLNHLSDCMMQTNLKKLFKNEEEDFEISYPHYGFILNLVVGQALKRKNYIFSAQQMLNHVFGNKMPVPLSNIILNYHDNKSLKEFANKLKAIFIEEVS